MNWIDQAIEHGAKRIVYFKQIGLTSWNARVGGKLVATIKEKRDGELYEIVYLNGGHRTPRTTRQHRGDLTGAQEKIQSQRGWVGGDSGDA